MFECSKVYISNWILDFTGTDRQVHLNFMDGRRSQLQLLTLCPTKLEPNLCLLNLFLSVAAPLYILKICIQVLSVSEGLVKPLNLAPPWVERKGLLGNSNCQAVFQKTKRVFKKKKKKAGRALPVFKRQVVGRREPVSWNSLGVRVVGVRRNSLWASCRTLICWGLAWVNRELVLIEGGSWLQRQLREVMVSLDRLKPT